MKKKLLNIEGPVKFDLEQDNELTNFSEENPPSGRTPIM